jgi:DNA modification methylase
MYVKGGKLNKNVVCNTVGDVIKSSRPGKEFHDMQQSTEEAEHFIKNYTLEDHGVVLDPMMGSATTGIAASNLKRKFIGIEKNENSFKIARARINKTIK